MIKACSIEGCERPFFAREKCHMHYYKEYLERRLKNEGKPLIYIGPCKVEGCGGPFYAGEKCKIHYYRDYYNRKLKRERKPRPEGPCKIEGCEVISYCKNLCCQHYSRDYQKNKMTPAQRAKRKVSRKRYYRENREKIIAYSKERYKADPEPWCKRSTEWQANNRERVRELDKREYRTNHHLRIQYCCRGRIWRACKDQGVRPIGKVWDLLGCSSEEFRAHLERQFQEGMTWENHGDWHMDHIVPCAHFDLKDPEQQKKCFIASNIQPLWKADHMKKRKVDNLRRDSTKTPS